MGPLWVGGAAVGQYGGVADGVALDQWGRCGSMGPLWVSMAVLPMGWMWVSGAAVCRWGGVVSGAVLSMGRCCQWGGVVNGAVLLTAAVPSGPAGRLWAAL